MKDIMENFSEADKRNIGLICIGFVPGFLFAISVSPEKEILLPFFGGTNIFGLIVVVATLIGLASGIIYLV